MNWVSFPLLCPTFFLLDLIRASPSSRSLCFSPPPEVPPLFHREMRVFPFSFLFLPSSCVVFFSMMGLFLFIPAHPHGLPVWFSHQKFSLAAAALLFFSSEQANSHPEPRPLGEYPSLSQYVPFRRKSFVLTVPPQLVAFTGNRFLAAILPWQ